MEGKKFTGQSYFYDSPIKDENMNACFNSGVTDNEGTRAAMPSKTIDNRTLSLNAYKSTRSDYVQKRLIVSMEGNQSCLPVKTVKQ